MRRMSQERRIMWAVIAVFSFLLMYRLLASTERLPARRQSTVTNEDLVAKLRHMDTRLKDLHEVGLDQYLGKIVQAVRDELAANGGAGAAPPPPPPPPGAIVDGGPQCQMPALKYAQCNSAAYARQRQIDAIKPEPGTPTPTCSESGLCDCNDPEYVFNGVSCYKAKENGWGEDHDSYKTLSDKWKQVPAQQEIYEGGELKVANADVGPAANGRAETSDILKLNDEDLIKFWKTQIPTDCFTSYYAGIMMNSKVLDIGSGLARQTMQFAMNGAHVTFLDLAASNLAVLRRVAGILGISDRVKFILLGSLDALEQLDGPYDFITAFGSMHHMPSERIRAELPPYFKALKKGGRWIQLAYPVNRWNQGTFKQFGQETDGDNTPWGEWYEPDKLLENMKRAGGMFDMLWCGIVNVNEFIWFDMYFHGYQQK